MTMLPSVETRRALFRQHVLRAGAFALHCSQERPHDDGALDRQRDNILQAMVACDRFAGAWQVVVDIALSFHDYIVRRGYWGVWEQYLEIALEACQRLEDARAEGALLNCLGEARRRKGHWDEAAALHERSLQIFQGLQDDAGVLRSYIYLGHMYWLRGGLDKARKHYEAALEIAEQVSGELGMAGLLYAGIGRTYSRQGEWEKALKYAQRAVQIAERLEDTALLTQLHNDMGYVHWRKGEWTKARRVFEQAMDLAERGRERVGVAIACNNIAAVLLSQGEWQQALEYLERDVQVLEPLGEVHLLAHAYDDLGDAYRLAGEWKQARYYLERSAEINRRLEDLPGLASTSHHLGLLCADQGEHERALAYHRQALELWEQSGREHDVAESLVHLAWARYQCPSTGFASRPSGQPRSEAERAGRSRDWDEMRAIADRAQALADRLGRRDLLARLLWLEAEVALAEGRPDDARAAYERASSVSRSNDNDRLIALHRETQARLRQLGA